MALLIWWEVLVGEITLRTNWKYLVAVVLLAVFAVVFGLAGTVMPASEAPLSSSSSDSVTHFMNPPTYNSSWLDITDKAGQYFNVTHNLNSTDIIVDITGRTVIDGGDHQINLGGTVVQKFGQTYGYPLNDQARSIIQTSDGGYTILGSASPGVNSDFWLVKTDADGNMQWNRTYGGQNSDNPYSVIQCEDEGYAMAGHTSSFGAGGIDFYLVKTDSSGNMEWNKTYGSADQDIAYSVIQTNDGGYAIAGHTYAFGGGDFWLFKTNATGDMQWNKTYGGSGDDHVYSIVQTVDGGYAMAGHTYSIGAGGADSWLVKTDANGNEQWNQTYGGAEWDSTSSLIETTDGGFALAGGTSSFSVGSSDFWLVKTDADGNLQWNETYGGKSQDLAESFIQTADGSYVIVGYTTSFGEGSYDYLVVKIDSNGIRQWAETYGSQWGESAYSIVEADDSGYAVAGNAGGSFPGPYSDFWVIKINTDGDHEWIQNYVESGLMWTNSDNDTITLCRGKTDNLWNYVRVRIWLIKEPTWQFGDINQDGIVDIQDVAIVGQNYGKTFSLLSLTGIIAVAGVHQYKKRKQPN